MKPIIYLAIYFLLSSNLHAANEPDTAMETSGIKVEFLETSQKGIIYVYGCDQCTKKYYTFTDKPRIKRKGQYISFEEFMNDYWNAKYPTLFLDKRTQSVLKVLY